MPTKDYDIVTPYAGAMIQSLRSFGYDLTTAIADLLDNSIAAEAKNIWLNFSWNGEQSYLSIVDDGSGMTENELINAMRPGSQHPLEKRKVKDLGRFGLGLKTASLSQCKRLTVRSKTENGIISTRCWDLNYLTESGEWRLLKNENSFTTEYLSPMNELVSGTQILWEDMDRIVSNTDVDNKKDHHHFLTHIEGVEKHLAMVFHRFLEMPNGLRIYINGRKIKPWNPFLENEIATLIVTEEPLQVNGKRFKVKAYVLPHHSKIDKEMFEYASGIKGWNAHQGFYVYRNKRMLVNGDWLGLGYQKEEHFKLARIAIEIPNDMDEEWEIDVKKSKAKPPYAVRQELKRIAKITREKASNVYRHRGKLIVRGHAAEYVYVWENKVRHGKTFYQINRNHPLVKSVLNESSFEGRKKVSVLLKMIEETLPVSVITVKNMEEINNDMKPFEGITAELKMAYDECYAALVRSGLSSEEAIKRLLVMEPFEMYPEIVSHFDEII